MVTQKPPTNDTYRRRNTFELCDKIISDLKRFLIVLGRNGNVILPLLFFLLFLQHDVAEKLGQNGLVSRHFGVAREIIDINDEVSVAISSVPYDVEIEEVQLEGPPEAPSDVDDKGIWGHLGVLQMHQPVIAIAVVFNVVVSQVGDLRKRQKVLRNADRLLLRHIG
ncbi:hypothetical protein V8G54_002581 [Vigna mungo]|uniref:Uncharacterized protein n=1 Tax=Vigna mungo TaxID=3915 RepID=A0AAQ3PBN4_VIGMU